MTNIDELLGKYVVVIYDKAPYPGLVEDVGDSDVYCECMHQVGRKKNCFFWPKKLKDKCWYELENIIAIIPPPQLIDGSYSHYCVDPCLWNQIIRITENQ